MVGMRRSIVTAALIMLMFLSFILLSILVFTFEKFAENWEIYFLTFGTVIGQVLFPIWFFQGMERMKYITYLNILSKSIFTVAIFVFIQKQGDYYIVPILTSLGFIVAGIWSLVLIKKEFGVEFRWQKVDTIVLYFQEGWYVFLSQFKISLFSTSNIIILGLFTNNVAVGYYTAAEKIMRALAMMQVPITGAIFPYIAKNIHNNKQATINNLKKIIYFGTLGYLVILAPIFIFSDTIITFLYSDKILESSVVLQIITIVPLTIFLNNIFGTQIMLNTHKQKEFFMVLFSGGIINLILCTLLTYYFSYIGTSIALLIVEIYVMLGMLYFVRRDLFVK